MPFKSLYPTAVPRGHREGRRPSETNSLFYLAKGKRANSSWSMGITIQGSAARAAGLKPKMRVDVLVNQETRVIWVTEVPEESPGWKTHQISKHTGAIRVSVTLHPSTNAFNTLASTKGDTYVSWNMRVLGAAPKGGVTFAIPEGVVTMLETAKKGLAEVAQDMESQIPMAAKTTAGKPTFESH